ncbi:MAG: hypothetical protein HOV80_07885 [Polyangiaceae bacterium]|nr:hypothetical protein [Polyangiaceae bacterium]
MLATYQQQQPNLARTGGGGTLYDVLELILDKGLVIDAFVRVSVVGIDLITIDVRVVVASVDTYLRFAERCDRLYLGETRKRTIGDLASGLAVDKAVGTMAVKSSMQQAQETIADLRAQLEAAHRERDASSPAPRQVAVESAPAPVEEPPAPPPVPVAKAHPVEARAKPANHHERLTRLARMRAQLRTALKNKPGGTS